MNYMCDQMDINNLVFTKYMSDRLITSLCLTLLAVFRVMDLPVK
jgi:hypothetical protein